MSRGAYYNEIEPSAAAWLRELMKGGHIVEGEIDTRSIVDVRPDELRGFTQCHFFAGIGGWSYALRLAGWPDDRPVWTGSCPCQPWSVAGSSAGADDPRHLWPAWFPLIRECRPPTVFGEQVASRDGAYWLDLVLSDMEGIEYAVGAFDLPAASAGAPHGRQRLWIVADDNRRGRAGLEAPRLHERRAGASGEAPAEGRAHGEQRDDVDGRGDDGRALGDPDGERGGRVAGNQDGTQRTAQGGGQDEGGRVAEPSHTGADVGNLADPARRGQRADRRTPGQRGHADQRGAAVDVADPDRVGRDRGPDRQGPPRAQAERGPQDDQPGDDGGLGNPDGARREGDGLLAIRAGGEGPEQDRGPSGSGATRDVGDARRAGLEGLWAGEAGPDGGPAARGAGPTFWTAVEWVPCIDGKVRPVEPGSFPLAHGIPARVGRLRGYGNAIVPQVASAVIAAYMDFKGVR